MVPVAWRRAAARPGGALPGFRWVSGGSVRHSSNKMIGPGVDHFMESLVQPSMCNCWQSRLPGLLEEEKKVLDLLQVAWQ
jgi:hypothetical protein